MKPTVDIIEQTKEALGCQFIQGYGMTEAGKEKSIEEFKSTTRTTEQHHIHYTLSSKGCLR